MNETHKDWMKEAEKKRRDYLQKKSTAHTVTINRAILTIVPLIVVSISLSLFRGSYTPSVIAWMLLFSALAVYQGRQLHVAAKRAASIPHVPPVRHQIAALPAEEVLLRSSEEPNVQPGELLRAAQAGKVEPKEELLRAEAMRSYDQQTDTVQVQQTRP